MPERLSGVGTDIIEVGRIRKAFERHGDRFLARLFTEKERAYCQQYRDPTPHFAGRFAAKEAILKALGTGLTGEMSWHDVEIINDAAGRPEVHFSARLEGDFPGRRLLVSISHTEEYATATAICVGV